MNEWTEADNELLRQKDAEIERLNARIAALERVVEAARNQWMDADLQSALAALDEQKVTDDVPSDTSILDRFLYYATLDKDTK